MNYSTPRGLIPQLLRYAGYFLAVYWAYGIAYYIVAACTTPASDFLNWIALGLLVMLFLLMLRASIGLTAVFPSVAVGEKGIQYRYFFFLKGLIEWDEIVDLVELKRPQGTWALVISRKGYSLFRKRGLFYNWFFGTAIGRTKPALFLSAGLGNLGAVIKEIRRRRVGHLSLPPTA